MEREMNCHQDLLCCCLKDKDIPTFPGFLINFYEVISIYNSLSLVPLNLVDLKMMLMKINQNYFQFSLIFKFFYLHKSLNSFPVNDKYCSLKYEMSII